MNSPRLFTSPASTAFDADGTTLFSASAGSRVLNLPTALSLNGTGTFRLVKSDATVNTITVTHHSGDTALSAVLESQWDSVDLQSDGVLTVSVVGSSSATDASSVATNLAAHTAATAAHGATGAIVGTTNVGQEISDKTITSAQVKNTAIDTPTNNVITEDNAEGFNILTSTGTQDVFNKDMSDTSNLFPQAAVGAVGDVRMSADGATTAGRAVAADDQRVNDDSAFMQPVLQDSLVPYGSVLTSGTAYAIYLGKTKGARTSARVALWVTTGGLGGQTAECAIASSTVPTGAGNVTLTKIGAATLTDDLTTTGIKTATVSSSIPENTHVWAIVRTAMATTQPILRGAAADRGLGLATTTAASGALTGAGPWTGVPVSGTQAVSNPFLWATLV